ALVDRLYCETSRIEYLEAASPGDIRFENPLCSYAFASYIGRAKRAKCRTSPKGRLRSDSHKSDVRVCAFRVAQDPPWCDRMKLRELHGEWTSGGLDTYDQHSRSVPGPPRTIVYDPPPRREGRVPALRHPDDCGSRHRPRHPARRFH